MRSNKLLATATIALFISSATAQTVTVTLSSSQDGQIVSPGATIDWQISFTVSGGDNEGLALLVCDLAQDPNNPVLFDIPPADAVPPAMSNFSRPDGVSNPGETNPDTGYIGVQRGTAGQRNLIQIGGGQNNTGEATLPGTGVGENANVVGGVGQSGSVTLASGSFAAPSSCGTFAFSLVDPIANVILQRLDPPAFSPVDSATVDASASTITFSVGLAGDLDFDGDVDLSDLAQLLANYGTPNGASYEDGDIDGDGDVDLGDLAALLAVYDTTCP